MGQCLYRWDYKDADIKIIMATFRYWHVVPNDRDSFEHALDLKSRYQTSYWDSLILAAALRSGAKTLWSEDFNHGQIYADLTVINPFKSV
ncbi:MAG: PIN domain-containing protein [Opitutales bacterium]|nr:PIN domain-containing protein [Opitutales bacterium]